MNENDKQVADKVKSIKPVQWLLTQVSTLNRRKIMDILLVLLPIALIYIYVNFSPSGVKQVMRENKQIDKKIDSLKDDNKFIVERMYELEKRQTMFFELINQNNDLIKENNKELQKLKKIYNEKINSVNSYTVTQLDSFFTSRYKDYYNK